MHEKFIKLYKNNNKIIFSIDHDKLDTGGALINSLLHTSENELLILNGDSYCDINIEDMFKFHNANNSHFTIATCLRNRRKDGGNISINNKSLITKFNEKENYTNFINAGVYIINRNIFNSVTPEKISLERDLIPKIIENKMSYAYQTQNNLFDIGTPDGYKKFCKYWGALK